MASQHTDTRRVHAHRAARDRRHHRRHRGDRDAGAPAGEDVRQRGFGHRVGARRRKRPARVRLAPAATAAMPTRSWGSRRRRGRAARASSARTSAPTRPPRAGYLRHADARQSRCRAAVGLQRRPRWPTATLSSRTRGARLDRHPVLLQQRRQQHLAGRGAVPRRVHRPSRTRRSDPVAPSFDRHRSAPVPIGHRRRT